MSTINKKIDAIALRHYNDNNSLFAKEMQTSEANIRNYRKSTIPKIDFIIKVKNKLEISFDELLTDSISNDLILKEPDAVYKLKNENIQTNQLVPLFDFEASAGIVELFKNQNGNNKPVDFISIPNLPKCDGAIYVAGDSMYPLLKSGDIIMYKELDNKIENIFYGEMYLISIEIEGQEFVSVKWLQKSDLGLEHILLVSQNKHHQSKDVHLSKVKALALIKGSIRINSMF